MKVFTLTVGFSCSLISCITFSKNTDTLSEFLMMSWLQGLYYIDDDILVSYVH